MSQKQIKIIIIEIVLILLGVIFYFVNDQFIHKKNNDEKELLRKKIVLLSEKIDAYSKQDKDEKFIKKFLELQKQLNNLTTAYADNKYEKSLNLYTKILEETENLKSEMFTYYKEKELKSELKKKEKALAKKEKKLKKIIQAKTIKKNSPKKKEKSTKTVQYTYTPLKKLNTNNNTQKTIAKVEKTQPQKPKTVNNTDNNGKVDINNATAEELETLPRIGPAYANRIIEYRKNHNGFKNVDELINISGIGEKTLKVLKPLVFCGVYQKGENISKNALSNTQNNVNKIKKININTATYEQLQQLPKIGPKLAQNIIDYREENGPFKSYEDLLNVPRIGEKTLKIIKPYITLGEVK